MSKAPSVVASVVVGVLGCGGGGAPQTVGFTPMSAPPGVGDCVDPMPATTRVVASGVDDQGRVLFCQQGAEACRAVDPTTGAMSEHYPKIAGGEYDQPGAVVEADGQLLVCRGQTSCLRKAPGPFEQWLTVRLAPSGSVAVLSSGEADRRFVTVLDPALTTTARFGVAPGANDLIWWADGRFVVHSADGPATRGHLYAADGAPRGTVGVLGAGAALDLGAGPVELAPGQWAFLAADASVVATHDVDGGDGVRVELGVADQPRNTAALVKLADGKLAVVLGGTRYGDLLVVDVDARKVTPRPATRCEAR